MMTGVAVKTICITAPLLAVSQIISPDLTWVGQIREAGLTGALLIAVWALWRSWESLIRKIDDAIQRKDGALAEKDKQILLMLEHVTAAQVAQVEASKELRKIVEESVRTKAELKASIDLLARSLEDLPCIMGEVKVRR